MLYSRQTVLLAFPYCYNKSASFAEDKRENFRCEKMALNSIQSWVERSSRYNILWNCELRGLRVVI